MFSLYEFQEIRHIRPPEMVDRLQSREHRRLRQTLEMILANVQHRGAQIKFVEKLRDKDVHFQHIGHILFLDVAQHINEPLEVFMRRTDPQKIHFFAGNARVAVGAGAEYQIV